MVQRSIESITTKYNVIEVLGEKRNETYKLIEAEIKTRLGENGIDFYSITFLDTDAGDAIETAIQNEAVAKKAVETAKQEKERLLIDSQKRIVEAEANKQKAQIEADTKIIQAKAEAESNQIIAQSLTENVLKKMEMDARMKHGWVTVMGSDAIVKEQ
jgi:regulator of protease activity HflC (stomatin/prohibitin superfamily)